MNSDDTATWQLLLGRLRVGRLQARYVGDPQLHTITVLPGSNERTELGALRILKQQSLRDQFERLNQEASGLALNGELFLDFTLGVPSCGLDDLLPEDPVLGSDGHGNDWVIANTIEEDAGKVMFISHDPPYAATVARNLHEFCAELASFEGVIEIPSSISRMSFERADNPSTYIKATLAREHPDATIRSFSASVPPTAFIIDGRSSRTGFRFNWALFGPRTDHYRDPDHLIFAVSPPGSKVSDAT